MAINSVSVLGKKSGVIGGLMFRVVDGVQIISSYNPRKFNPRSAAQTLQRAKFTMLTKNARIFADACYYGFVEIRKPLQTVQSIFIHENYPNVTGDAPEEVWLNPALIKVSTGTCTGVLFTGFSIDANVLTVNWDAQMDQTGTYGGDRVEIVVYNETKQCARVYYAYRSGQTKEMTIYGDAGDKVNIYGFVLGMGKNNKDLNSETTYIGQGILTT